MDCSLVLGIFDRGDNTYLKSGYSKQIKTPSLLSVFLTIPLDKLPCLLPFSPLGTKVEKEIVVLHSFFNYTHIHCHLVKCMNIFRVDQNLKFPVKTIFRSKVKYKSGSGKFALNLSLFWIDQIKLNTDKNCAKIQDS